MKIHKEGKSFLIKVFAVLVLLNMLSWYILKNSEGNGMLFVLITSLVVFLFFMNFFRDPERVFEGFEEGMIVSPADGTVVVIEPTEED
jgi:phosphatidylserine decarboxylase